MFDKKDLEFCFEFKKKNGDNIVEYSVKNKTEIIYKNFTNVTLGLDCDDSCDILEAPVNFKIEYINFLISSTFAENSRFFNHLKNQKIERHEWCNLIGTEFYMHELILNGYTGKFNILRFKAKVN